MTIKKSLSAFYVLLIVSTASAEKARLDLRFCGGATRAEYSGPPQFGTITEVSYAQASRFGPAAGIGVDLSVPHSLIVFVMSIDFIQKGSKVDWYYWDHLTHSWPYRLDTLSHSGLIKFKPFARLSPYVLVGYEVSLILGHKVTSPVQFDLLNDTRRFDFGTVTGAGAELAREKWAAFFEFRCHTGLINLSRGTDMLSSYPTIKTRALVLVGGIRLRLFGGNSRHSAGN